jgi:succinate dehydrogenase / fumarate reductase, cytochrome b subunit
VVGGCWSVADLQVYIHYFGRRSSVIRRLLFFSLLWEVPLQSQGVLPPQLVSLTRSSIGKKVIMAVTGLIWVGFVFFHMYGNLKVFEGAVYFNAYADGLRTVGGPIFGYTHLLWIARLGLIGALLLHVWAAISLYQQARKARPKSYAMHRTLQANYATKTIRYGGLAILFFVIYHLMHFTFGVPVVHGDFRAHDPYHNVIYGFQSAPVVAVYLVAVIVLGLHLYHGTWSMLQTLGLNNKAYDRLIRVVGLLLALVISVGFAIVPIAILFGFVE